MHSDSNCLYLTRAYLYFGSEVYIQSLKVSISNKRVKSWHMSISYISPVRDATISPRDKGVSESLRAYVTLHFSFVIKDILWTLDTISAVPKRLVFRTNALVCLRVENSILSTLADQCRLVDHPRRVACLSNRLLRLILTVDILIQIA